MQTTMTTAITIIPEQRARLVEFFGEKGAAVVLSHIDNLEETFGSASIVIRGVMQGRQRSG
jgi:hypothetical protein